jgi:hypothetical protein
VNWLCCKVEAAGPEESVAVPRPIVKTNSMRNMRKCSFSVDRRESFWDRSNAGTLQLIAFESVESYVYVSASIACPCSRISASCSQNREAVVVLSVVRRGNCGEACTVDWSTYNINLRPAQYRFTNGCTSSQLLTHVRCSDQSGSLSFVAGERRKEISFELEEPTGWDIERQMAVQLHPPDRESAILGELYKATVVVLADTLFPGDTYTLRP